MYDELVKALRQLSDYDLMDFLENRTYTQDIAQEAADAIEEIQGKYFLMKKTAEWLAEKVPKWISVSERLPEDRQSVLVHRDDGGIFIFEYFTTSPTDECWIDDHLNVYSAYSVTHWQPLPEPPKEEK